MSLSYRERVRVMMVPEATSRTGLHSSLSLLSFTGLASHLDAEFYSFLLSKILVTLLSFINLWDETYFSHSSETINVLTVAKHIAVFSGSKMMHIFLFLYDEFHWSLFG